MDNKDSCLLREPNAVGIYKTLYLFLQNHNFPKTAEILRGEWGLDRKDISKVQNISILLTRCKCSKSQANQTEAKSGKYSHGWLEGTFQGEKFQVKPDDTHVFYVCDHCLEGKTHTNDQRNRNDKSEVPEDKKPSSRVASPQYEVNKLKSRFAQLQEEHQKLIAVTTELTNALQMNIVGQTKNIYSVLEQCKSVYPSLFEKGTFQMPFYESGSEKLEPNQTVFQEIQLEAVRSTESKQSDSIKINIARASQFPEIPEPQPNPLPRLNLERLTPTSPLMTPLTPETVRYILETVFERIFELEKGRNLEDNENSLPLCKGDVEKIVGDVLNETAALPSSNGAGEGEFSRPDSDNVKRSQSFFDIDYPKLKADLIHGDNDRKIRILQALRWRITKNEAPIREKVVESYIMNDILDLFAGISIPERLLLGYGTDHYVQESTCRLINTLASLRQGRDYLTTDERLLKRVLIKKVKDVRAVSGAVIRNMLVASVQKLSIRKQCRTQMVCDGLFEVVVDYLDEFYEKLSKYCLEYCSALLMNLCLVEDAKNRSTKNPRKIIGLLRKFLESDNDFCLPYINGVMFSLFEKSEIVNEATHQNLDKILLKLIQITNNDNIKKQLDFILQSRLFGKSEPNIQGNDDDGKEEVDLLETELDQDDFITQLPSGEKLLQEYKTDSENIHTEKHLNPVSFASLRRDPPNSAKSFSEETKQYLHKPSSERGVFEVAKPRRYTLCSHSLIQNYVKNRSPNQTCAKFSATPLCYMENCQKLLNGGKSQCSCSNCVPGHSKYACGCYDAIKKEIADNEEDIAANYKNSEPKSSQSKLLKATDKSALIRKEEDEVSCKSSDGIRAESVEATVKDSTLNDNNDGGRKKSGCKVCGEKKCECAFESRPKICRTPTL